MNKMIKWAAIFGIVFCLAGVGIITAGAMMGGADELGQYIQGLEDDMVPRIARTPGLDLVPGLDGDPDSDLVIREPDPDLVMDSVSYDQVRELKIEAGPGKVIVVAEDREDEQDTAVRVESYGEDGVLTYPYEIRQEGGELEIERHHEFEHIVGPLKNRSGDYQNRRMENLLIYIPRDHRFRKVEIEAAAAAVTVEEIQADQLDIEVQAGALTLGRGTVGALDVECQAGSVVLGLEGEKQQFDYELTANVGTIILEDQEQERYTGLRREKNIDNHAGKKAELECDAGELIIRFTENGK